MQEWYGLIDVDLDYYRTSNRDLAGFDDEALLRHYYKYGYFEGRASHPRARREDLISAIEGLKTLEIGPFVSPGLTHKNVKYLDVLSTDELAARAKRLNKPIDNVPTIDFVSRDGTLSRVEEKFDLVFSAHNIEHQPDLISHLNQVSAVLNEGGAFAMMVPDARYCFDADLPLSKISDVFDAYLAKRKRHTLGRLIEHRAMVTHNRSQEHWKSKSKVHYKRLKVDCIAKALTEYFEAGDSYIDVHAWQFEPLSLSDIFRTLINLGYLEFKTVSCRGPVHGRNEFSIELQK